MSKEPEIPFIDLKLHYERHRSLLEPVILSVCASGQYILGSKVSEFERRFADFLGVREAVGVASGTDAITLSCQALGIGEGDEVLIPANTFIASAMGIFNLGATPIPIDVHPETLLMDLNDAEKKVGSKTKAIMPVHLYGRSVDLSILMEFATRHRISVIEDACQAHGASWNGKRVGSFGTFGCFSFYPSKNLGALGDGGMIATQDPSLAEQLRLLRNYGSVQKYVHKISGTNSRLDAIQAAILNVKLDYVDKFNNARFRAACRYAQSLDGLPEIKVPCFERENPSAHVFHLFVIQCTRRDELQAYLTQNGIQCGIHYPVPLHLHLAFSKLNFKEGACPVTESMARTILSLPMFPEITDQQVDRVVAAIKVFYG